MQEIPMQQYTHLPGRTPPRGFTLVELLVVIAIIGVLVGLLLPAVQVARESARRSACTNKLKQMALGVHNYESINGKLPHGSIHYDSRTNEGQLRGWTWVYLILPYMEEQELFDRGAVQSGETRENAARGRRLKDDSCSWMLCPSDAKKAGGQLASVKSLTNYAACGGPVSGRQSHVAACPWPSPYESYLREVGGRSGDPGGWYCTNQPNWIFGMFIGVDASGANGEADERTMTIRLTDVTDGLSKTIMLGETSKDHLRRACCGSASNGMGNSFGDALAMLPTNTGVPINWGPGPAGCEDGSWTYSNGFKSQHASGANFAFGDGTTKFVNENVSMRTYVRMGHKSDGSVYSADF
jgi:prepilin-type N-terminal cleavage/methylation domain-containing protein/prepilin-type processing-associated H-X9-DG protein